MCQPVIHLCSGSTRPLLFAGGLLSLLLALAIGYTGCTTNSLLNDINPQAASQHALGYYLQLAAAGYLVLVTLFSCYAAHYDEKHAIRALAFITSLNFILALVAILMMPQGADLVNQFKGTLEQAASRYDFKDKYPDEQNASMPTSPLQSAASSGGQAVALNLTASKPQKRWAGEEMDANDWKNATRIWDSLQERGCCGLNNYTVDWKAQMIPKSCCNRAAVKVNENDNTTTCTKVDESHSCGCLELIRSSSSNLLIVLSLIALVNFYLALIASISVYKTLHYDEASQSAYT